MRIMGIYFAMILLATELVNEGTDVKRAINRKAPSEYLLGAFLFIC
jgi:hypothetical protein